MDVDWELVVKLALPAKVTRRANKVIGIYFMEQISPDIIEITSVL
jgi:hypothetical protein